MSILDMHSKDRGKQKAQRVRGGRFVRYRETPQQKLTRLGVTPLQWQRYPHLIGMAANAPTKDLVAEIRRLHLVKY